jgi:hypothetical protein
MADSKAGARQEPMVAPVVIPMAANAASPTPAAIDQLSRIEDKTARIEEKFARYEAVLGRAEASLERSAHKVDEAASGMDFAGLSGELAKLEARVNATPRFGALVITALVTSLVTAVLVIIAAKTGLLGR